MSLRFLGALLPALALLSCNGATPIPDPEGQGNSYFFLGADGNANSYVILKAGQYVLNATVMGNGAEVEGLPAPVPVEADDAMLVWESTPGMISNLQLKDNGMLCFSASAKYGNALIAVTKAGEISWSWHIWHPSVVPTPLFSALGYDVMNLNLGAMSDVPKPNAQHTYGLLYQWGRKDPFPGSPSITGDTSTMPEPVYDAFGNALAIDHTPYNSLDNNTLEYAVAHPTVVISNYAQYATSRDWLVESNDALWGNPDPATPGVKSYFDPCPPGWRVPPVDVFKDATPSGGYEEQTTSFNVTGLFEYGWVLNLDKANGVRSFFPAAARYDGSYGMLYGSVAGVWGNYWGSAPYGHGLGASVLSFRAESMSPSAGGSRADAYSIRCIKEL